MSLTNRPTGIVNNNDHSSDCEEVTDEINPNYNTRTSAFTGLGRFVIGHDTDEEPSTSRTTGGNSNVATHLLNVNASSFFPIRGNNEAEGASEADTDKSDNNSSLTVTTGVADKGSNEGDTEASGTMECAICLMPCIHPVVLPCSHIFCFLCMKGIAQQSKRCAMCRQEIPLDCLNHPQLLNESELAQQLAQDDGYQWFYEGRNGGWWQYDERTSKELDMNYTEGKRTCDLLIAGFLYTVDFDAMLQVRWNDVSRRRRIKRDLAAISKKGIAGLRLDGRDRVEGSEEEIPVVPLRSRVKSPIPIPAPPTNTPQTPHTPSTNSNASSPGRHDEESLHYAMEQIRNLSLRHNRRQSASEEDSLENNSPVEIQNVPINSNRLLVALSSEEEDL